jgi:hypothetical protein
MFDLEYYNNITDFANVVVFNTGLIIIRDIESYTMTFKNGQLQLHPK